VFSPSPGLLRRPAARHRWGAPGRIDLNRLDGAKRVHMKVDLEKILKGETPDLALRPGDVIYVPTRLF